MPAAIILSDDAELRLARTLRRLPPPVTEAARIATTLLQSGRLFPSEIGFLEAMARKRVPPTPRQAGWMLRIAVCSKRPDLADRLSAMRSAASGA